MSTIKADGIQASTGTNTDLTLAGKGTGVPDLAANTADPTNITWPEKP